MARRTNEQFGVYIGLPVGEASKDDRLSQGVWGALNQFGVSEATQRIPTRMDLFYRGENPRTEIHPAGYSFSLDLKGENRRVDLTLITDPVRSYKGHSFNSCKIYFSFCIQEEGEEFPDFLARAKREWTGPHSTFNSLKGKHRKLHYLYLIYNHKLNEDKHGRSQLNAFTNELGGLVGLNNPQYPEELQPILFRPINDLMFEGMLYDYLSHDLKDAIAQLRIPDDEFNEKIRLFNIANDSLESSLQNSPSRRTDHTQSGESDPDQSAWFDFFKTLDASFSQESPPRGTDHTQPGEPDPDQTGWCDCMTDNKCNVM